MVIISAGILANYRISLKEVFHEIFTGLLFYEVFLFK